MAYSACGNLALSEDVAQETFWTAWRQRASLEQPDRVRVWLCGIARNLAKDARRKASRHPESAEAEHALDGLYADLPGPEEEAVSREEESLVWQTLGRIPETYREPLVLFYRENHSVADVAEALGLSEDATKQRLSRGRRMLREQVAELVEGSLRRTRPGRRFTLGVMAGLTANASGAKAALAGVRASAVALKATAGVAGAGGLIGGLLGSLVGLMGGWLGTWAATQAAPTQGEREAIRRTGRRLLLGSAIFIAALPGLIYAFAGTPTYLAVWGCWIVSFGAYHALACVRLARELKHVRAERAPDNPPNETALRTGWTAVAQWIGDRVYRSEATFLGLPLIDINLSAPMPPGVDAHAGASPLDVGRRVARGWVAIGDDARGILLAIGSSARGLVALGGRAFGVVSFGGMALGLVAFGGLGLGVVGVGGLGAGVYAIGGGAVGSRTAGGLAVGWDMACGGGAFARHAALGGAAIARDYAVGGDARALHANDEAARRAVLDHPFTRFAFTLIGQRRVLQQLAGETRARDPTTAATQQFRLDNGLAVRIRPIQGAGNVALLVLYNVGSDHDPAGRSGLAHLVEHLYVTSTAGDAPARTAEAFFRSYPSGCNAQTGDRYTVIATVFPKAELDRELTEAAARMVDLRITAEELQREKQRLRDEVANMFGRIPSLGAMNTARELIRPTPREGRKGGLPDHVNAITLDEVRARWRRYYKPRNAILVLAGAVDGAARQVVTAHFAGLAPGEEVPKPGEPGPSKAGTVREEAFQTPQPQAEPVAFLAYAAPEPASELYAPFLVLVARLWAASAGPGGDRTGRPSLHFPLLEDPAVLGVSATAKPGETAARAIARLDSFVADTVAAPLRDDERASARAMFAFFLGTDDIPESALARNPYAAALSVARREQLRIDPLKLRRALDTVTDRDVRRAAGEIFNPARRAGAFLSSIK